MTPERRAMSPEVTKTDDEGQKELTPAQYQVLRHAGTEPAFTGEYWDCHDDGMYRCAACGAELFTSDTKFESGTGWPSFTEPAVADAVELRRDSSHGLVRTEVVLRRRGRQLGYVCERPPSSVAQIARLALRCGGGSRLMPGSLSLIAASFRTEDHGAAIGAWSALTGAATAIGPFLGGWLVDAVSWRLVFLINLPLAAVALFVQLRSGPQSREPPAG